MLETPEARAKLRRKLETWPDDRKSPVTVSQGLELLDILEKQEKELEWLAEFVFSLKLCPMIKAYKCKYLDDNDYPSSECINCWREAARKSALEAQNV